ncbi:MAG: cytochrome c biogenesis protein [Candidatus Dojkabacteria bacterium]|nr:cytochrome c biogenesis protein [Candidatus Dojkabacteria bacterium]
MKRDIEKANNLIKYILISLGIFVVLLVTFALLTYSNQNKDNNERNYPEGTVVMTYFTGIGCPHCAKVSPVIHKELENNDKLVILEYELYKETRNSQVFTDYVNRYGLELGIPQVMYNETLDRAGDTPFINNISQDITQLIPNTLYLSDRKISWDELFLNDLEGYPKIYTLDRVAYRGDSADITDESNTTIKEFLLTNDIDKYAKDLKGTKLDDLTIQTPSGILTYQNGIRIESWNILWNGINPDEYVTQEDNNEQEVQDTGKISILQVIGLAITDSINPCALTVLLMMLLAIATYHPKKKSQVLLAGLMFILSVFIIYMLYGILVIKAAQLLSSINIFRGIASVYLNIVLGIFALILAVLELKDFFKYKPGSLGTEMPMKWREKVQKIVAKISSPLGALGLGAFVTVFLLPCTAGPVLILGGMLSFRDLLSNIPILLLYNFIFVLPMIVVVFLVSLGKKKVEDISNWKEKNIRIIHLIIGLIFLTLGIYILIQNINLLLP